MKYFINNFGKITWFKICIFLTLVIGVLIILNISLNLSAPAIDNDDSGSIFSQLNIDSALNKHPLREKHSLAIPEAIKLKIIPLFIVLAFVFGSSLYKNLTFYIRFRGPPLNEIFFA